MVLCHGQSGSEAFKPLAQIHPVLVAFRDPSYGLCSYQMTCLDVLLGLAKAARCGFVSLDSFDYQLYWYYSAIHNGDLNWVVPGKFAAHSGPFEIRQVKIAKLLVRLLPSPSSPPNFVHFRRPITGGRTTLSASDYAGLFKRLGIGAVIRLNKKHYPRSVRPRTPFVRFVCVCVTFLTSY